MDTFTYDNMIGVEKEVDLMVDGKKCGSYHVFPVVPFSRRVDAIQSIIESVVDETEYMPYNYQMALWFALMRTYTDLAFPPATIDDIPDESAEDRERRQSDANMSKVFEFIMRSSVPKTLEKEVYGFSEMISEIQNGISFAVQRLHNQTVWNDIGLKINNTLNRLHTALGDVDVPAVANGIVDLLVDTVSVADQKE